MSEQFAEQADVVVDNDTSGLDSEPSEILDEDRLEADPLEAGMDTAEGYSRTVRLGGTEDVEDQDALAHRLPQEEPDVVAEEPPARPVAATPAMDLDESVDDPANAVDGVDDPLTEQETDPAHRPARPARPPPPAGGPRRWCSCSSCSRWTPSRGLAAVHERAGGLHVRSRTGISPAFTLFDGQCASGKLGDGATYGSATDTPCGDPHDVEVVGATTPLNESRQVSYPGAQEMADFGRAYCAMVASSGQVAPDRERRGPVRPDGGRDRPERGDLRCAERALRRVVRGTPGLLRDHPDRWTEAHGSFLGDLRSSVG